MPKILTILFLVMMAVHILKPLGWPGLKRRRDFWKIAVAALGAMMLTVLIRP